MAGFRFETVNVAAGAAAYRRDGTAMTPAAIEMVRSADATFKGPVGLPDVRLPDGTEAGLLGGILRGGLDTYANVRPVRLFPGVRSRLRAEPGSIDYTIVRENTEGLYLSRGHGVGNEHAMSDTLLVTRIGCERISRYAFEPARRRSGAPADGASRVSLVDKANVLRSMYFFRRVFLDVAAEYPDIEAECIHADAAAQALVMEPEHFDVIVTEKTCSATSSSDLGGGTVGGVAMCPAANIGATCAYFEPIHGSAPAIAGRSRANPLGQTLAAAMMLEHLGEPDAARRLTDAVTATLADARVEILPDGGARGGPDAVGAALVEELRHIPVESPTS